jgi:hypothetical protein
MKTRLKLLAAAALLMALTIQPVSAGPGGCIITEYFAEDEQACANLCQSRGCSNYEFWEPSCVCY